MAAQCPICAQELADVDAVRQHTLAEHGVEAAHDSLGQWTTVAGPAAPSWQPDPWNPNAQRWWDGSEWTGRVAPAGPAPPDPRHETPGPPGAVLVASVAHDPSSWDETARSRKRQAPTFQRSRRGPEVLIGAAVVVAIVVVAAVVFSSSSGSPPKNTQGGVPLAPVALGPSAGEQGLGAGLLDVSDLGPAWTPHPYGHPMAPADYTHGPCGSKLWAQDVGGYEASFLNGDAAGQSHGAVVNEVLEATSARVASQQQRFVASPGFLTCLNVTDGQEALSQLRGATLGQVSADPYALHLPTSTRAAIQSTAYVVTIPVAGQGGAQTITDDSVVMFSGPYEATLDVSWSSLAPLTQQIVQLQADALAIHLAALPPAGTV